MEETELAGAERRPPSPSPQPAAAAEPRGLRDHERRLIESVLAECRGRVSGERGAAARLEVPATTLESKIKRYGIDKHRFRS